MPIVNTDLVMRLSGGAGNTDPNASLGGAISSTAVVDNTLNNLWDNTTGQESNDGDIEYRCIYIRDSHGTNQAITTVIWVDSNTTGTGDTIDIGLGTSAINGTEQTVADESTAPSGVTFSAPSTYATGLSIGNVPAGQHKAVWIRRTVTAGQSAKDNNTYVLKVQCDTQE